MTAQLELERILDDFLVACADALADHLRDAALRDTKHVPQRRVTRVSRRYSDMPTPLRLLAAAAILATALGGAFILGGTINRQTTPEPSPHPSPATLDDAAVVLGSHPAGRYVADRGSAYGFAGGEVSLTIPGPNSQSLVVTAPNGRLVLTGNIDNTGNRAILSATERCPEPGTYDWAVTDENLTFELTRVADSCADRVAFLEGAWRRNSMALQGVPGQRYELPLNGQTLALTIP